MSALTPFSSVIAGRERQGRSVTFHLHADWQQGRTAYGGVVAAVAAQAMRDVAGAAWPADVTLRSLQCAFVSVVAAGDVTAQVEVLRQGRNVCHVMARVGNGDAPGSVLIGVYSADRPSVMTPRAPQRPPAPAEADALRELVFRADRMPPFFQHLDARVAWGERPFSGRRSDRSVIHLKLRDPGVGTLEPEVLAVLLGDMPATPALSELPGPAATSSVTWALELRPVPRAGVDGWWRIDSESVVVDGGYVNHAARLWAPDGRVAALGTQVVTAFG